MRTRVANVNVEAPISSAEDETRPMRSIRDVARIAGVSTATVSRVIRGEETVAANTRADVLRTIKELDFRPNSLAQGLRSGKTNTVALAVGDIEQGWYSGVTRNLQITLEAQGLDILLFNLGHSENRLERLLDRAETLRLRGIAIASSDKVDKHRFEAKAADLKRANIPILSLAQRLDKFGVHAIIHDDVAAAEDAVRLFVDLGISKIAYLGRVADSATGSERYRGYRRGLKRFGLAGSEQLIWDRSVPRKYRYDAGYHAIASALAAGVKVRGLLAGSDELALGAMAAVQDKGLRVPDDIAIIGFGGLDWGLHTRPSLTTMHSDLELLAAKACTFFTAKQPWDFPLLTKIARPLRRGGSA